MLIITHTLSKSISPHNSGKYLTSYSKILDNLNSIIEHAILLDSVTFDNKQKSPNSVMMHALYALSDTGQGVELIKLYVDEIYTPNANQTIKRAYKLNGYNKIQLKTGLGLGKKAYSTLNATGSTYTVADLFNFVKQNDKNFNPKPASVVVNENGTPKVVYHGSGVDKRGRTLFVAFLLQMI